jgi:tetratricopeptide (TPR) repeat protein
MRKAFSILVLVLCCLLSATFVVASARILPHAVIYDSEGWESMFFGLMVCPPLAGGTLFLGILPSALMFWKGGRRTIDCISLWVSGTTLALIGLALLLLEPSRQAICFRQSDVLWTLGFFLVPVGVAILFTLVLALGTLAVRGLRRSSQVGRARIVCTSILGGAIAALCALVVLIVIRSRLAHLDDFRREVELGTTARMQGRLEEAVAHYRVALAAQPNNAELHYYMGRALAEECRFDAAVAEYRQALSLKPDYAEAYYRLGLVLAATGRRAETVAAFRKAVMLQPDFPMASRGLRWAENWAKESNSPKGPRP